MQEDLSKSKSTHAVASCLWGWRFEDEGLDNMMWCLGYEGMHNDELGVWLYVVEHVEEYLETKLGKAQARKVRMPWRCVRSGKVPQCCAHGVAHTSCISRFAYSLNAITGNQGHERQAAAAAPRRGLPAAVLQWRVLPWARPMPSQGAQERRAGGATRVQRLR